MSLLRGSFPSLFILSLALLLVVVLNACSTTKPQPPTVLTLDNPVYAHTPAASLSVGSNRWSGQNPQLIELFLPLAVTVRNTAAQPLCGGVATALLSDATGSSTSAVFPEGVVARLIGPLATYVTPPPSIQPAVHRGTFPVMRQQVGRVWGVDSGVPGSFGPRPAFSPGGFGSGMGGGFGGGPFWGGGFPFPFSRSYANPFYDPWPSVGRFPHSRRFPPPPAMEPIPEPEETKAHLLHEIFSLAFTSRPLSAQEERTGFLFFPLGAPATGSQTLTWDWYDCTTQALVAHLTVPVALTPR